MAQNKNHTNSQNIQREHLKQKCKKLTKLKLLEIPQLRQNPLTIELLNKYSCKIDKNKLLIEKMMIDLYDFIHGTCLEKKLKFLFDFYDTNADGFITKTDLFKILSAVSDYKMDIDVINQIIDNTLLGGRVEQIDFLKFKNMLEFKGILKKCMTGKI
ncbi:Calcineurin subunit B type 1 [Cucumispora dikerogammari]|nr:Calcineurin subunit B type 1 [Cucumispora dikerogammari]